MTQAVTTNREDWLQARLALLEREKAHSRAGDELAAARRSLPRLRLEQDYVFQGPNGSVSLSELFAGPSSARGTRFWGYSAVG